MKMKNILIIFFVLLIISSLGYLWFAPSGLQKAPELTLQKIDGKKVDLASFKGKPLLVTFWATSCPGCIKEMPHLVKLYKELNPKGLEIIGIAMPYDRPDYIMEMVKRKKLPYKIAFDLKGEAVRAFGNVSLTPTNFLIDEHGKIVKKKIGEMNEAVWEKKIISLLKKS